MTGVQLTQTAPLETVQHALDLLLGVANFWPASNGLVLRGRETVCKIGLSVSLTSRAVEQAVRRGCDLLTAHYPTLVPSDAPGAEAKLGRLRGAGISLYLCHESLDCARVFGTADALARAAQVVVKGPFRPDGVLECAVYGVAAGRFSEFVTSVANRLGVEARGWKNSDRFGVVAVMPGWGGRPLWMLRAKELGCDTILTGEILLPGLLFAREAGLNLVVAGHQASKTPGVLSLAARIGRELGLEVTFIPDDPVEAVL